MNDDWVCPKCRESANGDECVLCGADRPGERPPERGYEPPPRVGERGLSLDDAVLALLARGHCRHVWQIASAAAGRAPEVEVEAALYRLRKRGLAVQDTRDKSWRLR